MTGRGNQYVSYIIVYLSFGVVLTRSLSKGGTGVLLSVYQTNCSDVMYALLAVNESPVSIEHSCGSQAAAKRHL